MQLAVKSLQSNKVLGAIAFAYGFRDDGVARAPHNRLHLYADMLEAFIETVFEDDLLAGTRWLKVLWSSRCFPDLKPYLDEHCRSKGQCLASPRSIDAHCIGVLHLTGMPYRYSDLDQARACWHWKRQKGLSRKARAERKSLSRKARGDRKAHSRKARAEWKALSGKGGRPPV